MESLGGVERPSRVDTEGRVFVRRPGNKDSGLWVSITTESLRINEPRKRHDITSKLLKVALNKHILKSIRIIFTVRLHVL